MATVEEQPVRSEEPTASADTHNRNEKKALKILQKLGLKEVPGFTKCELKRSNQMPVCVQNPVVVELPGKTPTYIVLGPLRVDDFREEFARHAQLMKAKAAAAAMEPKAPVVPQEAEPEADAEGLNESDIKLAMDQTGKSRNEVIAVLRKTNGELIDAIMQLTS